jgi:methionyl-tRNA formyltransferase
MRIALITQEDPFYLPPALDRICQVRQDDVVAMIILPSFNEGLVDTAKRLYEFYGPVDFVRLCGRYVQAKLLDRVNRVVPLSQPCSAQDIARRFSIPVYQPPKINAAEFVMTLRELICPDILVSIAASQILKKKVLETPPLGCINLHSAPLPRYQGMMPNFWVLLYQEPEATVTVHYMVEKLDAGDIILQRPVAIHTSDSLHDVMIRSKEVGAEAVLEALQQIESGVVSPQTMDASQATYFSFPKREDARKLRAQGRRLL